MKRYVVLFFALIFAGFIQAEMKMEIFELQNRDAASLVPVIANVVGPEGRVSADERTNSLLVSYPAGLDSNLRKIITTLDRAEPNITVELVSFEAKSAWINHLGLTGRASLTAEEYASLLPLLTTSKDVTSRQTQTVTTKNNVPAQLLTSSQRRGQHYDGYRHYPEPIEQQWLYVTPQARQNGLIEVQLSSGSPSVATRHATSQIYTTVIVEDGGALVVGGLRQSGSSSTKTQVPLIPLGVESAREGEYEQMAFLRVSTTNSKPAENE
ncbi:MAG: secretin N-terminal domain-containing protein [Puniceicoccales bacterium]